VGSLNRVKKGKTIIFADKMKNMHFISLESRRLSSKFEKRSDNVHLLVSSKGKDCSLSLS
jgi:hypothetical protein